MAYNKTIWKDQDVEKPRTYSVRDNGDDTVTLLDAFGTVTELGTPVNAENMNKIENKLYDLDAAVATKQATIIGAATTITGSNLTASRALISNGSGKVAVSAVTSTELGYLDGVTSSIQTQLNGKQATIIGAATSVTSSNLTASRALVSNSNGKIAVATTTLTELGFVHGVTSAIQTQINGTVKTSGNQTIGGTKTFSSTIAGSINGNAATVTNGVYTTGSQSIAGKKTFTNVPYIAMTHPSIHEQKTELTKGTAPTSSQDTSGGISFVDKDDKVLADILFGYTTEKKTLVALRPHKANASGDTAVSTLSIVYPASGNPYTTAPASDEEDSIVTTKAISKKPRGYIQLGNGIIINWGAATESTRTVNFAKTFPTKCCSVVGTCTYTGETSAGHGYVTDITTSSFKYTGVDNDMQPFQWIAIGY